jgi:hypothetical protein
MTSACKGKITYLGQNIFLSLDHFTLAIYEYMFGSFFLSSRTPGLGLMLWKFFSWSQRDERESYVGLFYCECTLRFEASVI